jgi:Protein of unknown function (DUF2510)
MTTWHKGPPPSIGWWPASKAGNPKCLRWWNGAAWSLDCYSDMRTETAERRAGFKALVQDNIKWTKRPASWPERSRT